MEFHAFLAKSTLILFAIISGMFGGFTLPSVATSTLSHATSTKATSTAVLIAPSQSGTGFFTPSWPKLTLGFPATTTIFFTIPHSTTTGGSSIVPPLVIRPPVVTPNPPVVATTTPGTIEITPTQPPVVTADVAQVEKSIVHILCTSKKTGLRSISGSGSIIDSRGLIITAAHVGQYFLIERASGGADMSCVIRMGDPAKAMYKATPIYVSQSWIANNATAITQQQAIGNGKDDFGILAITGSVTGESLPASFPSLTLGSVTPAANDPIIIGTYGAEFLTSEQIRSSLSPTIVETSIKKVYSLKVTPVDLISLGASAAAQSGSSGGIVVDGGRAIGVVTTSSLGADRSTRDLRAITIQHIRKSYEGETGGSFDLDMQASIYSLIQKFAGVEEVLAQTLNKAINDAN